MPTYKKDKQAAEKKPLKGGHQCQQFQWLWVPTNIHNTAHTNANKLTRGLKGGHWSWEPKIFVINFICSPQVPKNTRAKYYSFILSIDKDVPLWASLNDCFHLCFQTLHLVFSEPIFLPRGQMLGVISWDVLVRFAPFSLHSKAYELSSAIKPQKYNIRFC